MSMHRFPVNPRQTYSERMIAARAQLRQMVKEKLCESSWPRRATVRRAARPALGTAELTADPARR